MLATKKKPITKEIGRMIGRRKKLIGSLGEALVVKHLKNKGFSHIESNFLKKQGELDVIMEQNGVIHFLEVKTVSRENMLKESEPSTDVNHETVTRETLRSIQNHEDFRPEENVTNTKLQKISRMIKLFLTERGFADREWQFHVAAVFLDQANRKALIRFTKNIPVNG